MVLGQSRSGRPLLRAGAIAAVAALLLAGCAKSTGSGCSFT